MAYVQRDSGAQLDATFSVERHSGAYSVLFHSRGGTKGTASARNTDYNAGLDLVLERLAQAGAVLNDALVESSATRGLPAAARRLLVPDNPYPVDLRSVSSITAYRRALGRAQADVGREEGARGGGNPTKQIRLHLRLPVRAVWAGGSLERYLAKPRRLFALLARPSVYDVGRASRELEIDSWALPSGDVDAGDRCVIWQSTDHDGRRGIVAFGEVLEPPSLREHAPGSLPFWRDVPPQGPQRRFVLRYVSAPGLPLWLDEDTSGLLEQLSVSRGQGTKLYVVAPEQWAQLTERSRAEFDTGMPASEAVNSVADSQYEDAEEEALRNAPLPPTEREALVSARRGQGRFRAEVLKLEPRCRVTGVDEEPLLVASHIWPWRFASNRERLDPHNGLMLAPHIDVLFDRGLITFTDDGALVTSPELSEGTATKLGLPRNADVGRFRGEQAVYLARHRAGIFRG